MNTGRADTTPLLRVEGLTVEFRGRAGPVRVLDGVGFDVARGRTLGVVGESGSGKSVLCLALLGLLPHPAGRVTGGMARFREQDLLRLPASGLRRLRGERIAMVFQDPLAALNPYLTVGAQLAEPLRVHRGCSAAEARTRAVQALDEVGIPDPAHRVDDYPHEFSGGQRQRILIAMALITEPDLLLADEPTTALDVTIQAQILSLLAELQHRHGLAMVFISHDLHVVGAIADDVIVLHRGRCVESGPAHAVLAAPRDDHTRRLLDAIPRGPTVRGPPAAPAASTPARLGVAHLYARHGGAGATAPAVDDVSLSIGPGEILGLVGETGSGKSTLARALLRLHAVERGTIRVGDTPWSALSAGALRRQRRRMQIIFQDPYASLNPRRSVYQCLAEALAAGPRAPPPRLMRAAVEQALADVDLPADAADRYPHAFSGGQRQRIAIARALAPEPELVVADEPVSALDATVQGQIVALLLRLTRQRGLSMLFISHDLGVIRAIADRVAVMQHGRIVETADTETLFVAPVHAHTRLLLASLHALRDGARAPCAGSGPPAGMRE
jgi:ABC-type microcin C transport system duplicated ATPase subunit YejF